MTQANGRRKPKLVVELSRSEEQPDDQTVVSYTATVTTAAGTTTWEATVMLARRQILVLLKDDPDHLDVFDVKDIDEHEATVVRSVQYYVNERAEEVFDG